mmetsp:Transcript_33254/g.38503  ORF Transcript_33254/g.38503 Transcript_33254/m.38503 type:complete len:376 (+) Transcript_33254:205-1332(+)
MKRISNYLSISVLIHYTFFCIYALDNDSTDEKFLRQLQLTKYSIEFVDAEAPRIDNLLAEDNVLINYIVDPPGNKYEAETRGINDETGKCKNDDEGSTETPYASISDETSSGMGSPGYQLVVNIIRSAVVGEDVIVFCVRNTLFDSGDEAVTGHDTIVTGKFLFNGEFQIEGIVPAVPDPSDVDRFGFDKGYEVEAYQCTTDPPHIETSLPVTQISKLGLCVITIGDDTLMDSVVVFEINQGILKQGCVENSIPVPGLGSYNCQLSKPGSDIVGSLCFLEIAVTNPFFDNPFLPITGSGVVDLKLIKERRALANVNHDPRQSRLLRGDIIRLNYEVTFSLSSFKAAGFSKAISQTSQSNCAHRLLVAFMLVFVQI